MCSGTPKVRYGPLRCKIEKNGRRGVSLGTGDPTGQLFSNDMGRRV